MSRDPARLLRLHKKFGIGLGRRNLMALDPAGRRHLALDAAGAFAAARSLRDAVADLQPFRHAGLRTKFSPNAPDAIRLQGLADRRGEFGFPCRFVIGLERASDFTSAQRGSSGKNLCQFSFRNTERVL
jgi:hypothetical protein